MRAFMSTDYPRFTHLCAYAPPHAAPFRIDEWLENDKALKAFTSEAAVREARAILAETEPRWPIRGAHPNTADTHVAALRYRGCVEGIALAEALAAFVEGGI